MGGAQRNQQRKRNQRNSNQAAKAIAAARGSSSGRGKMIAAIAVIVVFAVVVIGFVLYSNQQKSAIQASPVNTSYPVKVGNDDTIVAGKDSAKVKLDFYEDFICPSCRQFNQLWFDKVDDELSKGTVQVTYHFLPFLDDHSSPAGYSGRAAQAALAVAKNSPDKFASFEHSLYSDQPQEGSAGYSDNQLVDLGKTLGAGGNFEAEVRANKYLPSLQQALKTALPVMAKGSPNGNPSTPTILHGTQPQVWATAGQNNQAVPTTWLQDLVSGKQS